MPEPETVTAIGLSQSWGDQTAERIVGTLQSYVVDGYSSNSVVFACLLERIKLLAQAEFKFQDLRTRGLFGTPSLRLLEEPWPNGTTSDLIARMEQYASLAGNAFVRRAGDGLVVMRPDWVSIASVEIVEGNDEYGRPMTHREVIGYVYWDGGEGCSEPVFYPVQDVAHWAPMPDPLAAWRGMSWLTPVLREINADMAMTKHRQTFFDNAATPNLMLKYQQRLTQDQLDRIKRQWQARYAGPRGAGATVILDEGADFTVVGQSFDKMDFTNVQAAGEARIASAAGVPAIVAGLQAGLDAATYSNYGMAIKAMANGTGAYSWRSLCSALAKLVDVPVGARLWYDTTNIPALREDEKDRAAAMQVLAGAASTLLQAGYEAQSITAALVSGDLTQLVHTGMVSVQLYKPGAVPEMPAPVRDLEQAVRGLERQLEVARAAAGDVIHIHPSDPTPVTVEAPSVRVDAAPQPNVVVNVDPTPVTVQVDAPVVNVDAPVTVEPAPPTPIKVNVSPTPVTVQPATPTVTVLPQPPRTVKIKRDPEGNITSAVSE